MLKAYIDLLSQPSRTLYMFLKYTKIPHSIQFVSVMERGHLSEEFSKVNPFKKVPAIDDDGVTLSESVAIMQYLCRKHDIDYLYPKDLVQRAKIEGFTHWHHLHLRYSASNMFMSLLREPMEKGKPVNKGRLELSTKVFKRSLLEMENIYLKDTNFLASPSLSIADLLAVCELMQVEYGLCMDTTSDYPKVKNWTELVRSSVGVELFDETHQVIKALGLKFKMSDAPTPKL